MTRGWLRSWLFVLALSVACRTRAAEPRLETGDLVFQTSRSSQSRGIQLATASPWSHVGILEVASDGTFVVEAIGRVSRTPWRRWLARGAGGRLLVLRPAALPAEARSRAVSEARRHLGKPYDPRFGWGDDRMYCSELVVKAYARGADVSFGRMQRVAELRIAGLEAAIRARWGEVPGDLELVTPASLAGDARLARVYERR
jgi:hypothetical protein